MTAHGQALLIGQADAGSGKAFGLPPGIIDALAASSHFDVIINEADGSRMRPLKAPAAHEPVIPGCTTLLVPAAGLDVLGQALSDEAVHRADLVSQLSGAVLGQPITGATVAAILAHPEGGLKNAPAQARIIPFLNKVDQKVGRLEDGKVGGERLEIARDIAGKLLNCERIDSVVIGAAQRADSPVAEVHRRIAAIILAAGGSTRFGSPKQLARWADKTFIEQVVDTALASSAGPVIVVLGAEAERCRAVLGDRPVEVVINQAWAQGQSTSMQAGLAALPANIGGALFLLVDLPGISPHLIDLLIQRYRETLAPLVWPEFEGRRGNPVLFDCALFPALRQVKGDTGGKPVLLHYQDQAERVIVSDKHVLQDFDRPEDLAALEPGQ
jgi:molybdenum cofactor cytidylyltransferase